MSDWGFELPDFLNSYKRTSIRMPDGSTREVMVGQDVDPLEIPYLPGEGPKAQQRRAERLNNPKPLPIVNAPEDMGEPRTIDTVIDEQPSFWDKLKTAGNFAMDPVGTVHGPDAYKKVVTQLAGEGKSPLGVAGRTIAEKGLQMASSPLTGLFAVPGVATSALGRVAAAGFGGMAAKGGGEQLGEVVAMTQDQGKSWDDPEVVRAATSGALDLGMAPLAAIGALHGEPMKAANKFGKEVLEPALQRAAPKVGALARDLGYTEVPNLSRMIPDEEAARIISERENQPGWETDPTPERVDAMMKRPSEVLDKDFSTDMARPVGVEPGIPDDLASLIADSREASNPGLNDRLIRIDNMMQETIRRVRDRMAEISPDDALKDLNIRMSTSKGTSFDPATGTIIFNPFELARRAKTPTEFADIIREALTHEPGHQYGVHDVPTFQGQGEAFAAAVPDAELAMLQKLGKSQDVAGLMGKLDQMGQLDKLSNAELPVNPVLSHEGVAVPADMMTHTTENMARRAGISGEESRFYGAMDRFQHDPQILSVFDRLRQNIEGNPDLYEGLLPPGEVPVEPVSPEKALPRQRFNSPEEEGASLMDILNSDATAEQKMMAQLRLEEIMNPDIPDASVVDKLNEADLSKILEEEAPSKPLQQTVRPANTPIPEGKEVTKVSAVEDPPVTNLNHVIDRMFGEGKRIKAAQLRQAKDVYLKLQETSDKPTRSQLDALLKGAQGEATPPKVEAPREAPPATEAVPPQETPGADVTSLKKDLRRAEAMGRWSDVERIKGEIAKAEQAATPPPEAAPTEAAPATPLVEKAPVPEPVGKAPQPKKFADMTPEELEAEAVAAENHMRDGKPDPEFERASSLRRMAEQKKGEAARAAQVEANRQATAAATKAAPPPKKVMEARPVEPVKPKTEPAPVEPVATNPLEKKIPKSGRKLREVNPVEVFTGETPEPKTPKPMAEADKVAAKVEESTGQKVSNPPALDTPEGKTFVKALADNMGITEEKAASLVSKQGKTKSTVPSGKGTVSKGANTKTQTPPAKTVPGAGKTVQGQNSGGSQVPPGAPGGTSQPPATPTPKLPRPKGKRPTLDLIGWMRQRRTGDVGAELTRRKFSKVPGGVQAQLDFEAGTLKLPEVRQWLDAKHRQLRKAGVDVGYVENYLTHLWKESPSQVRQILGKRLGLKPGISMTRSIPTLAEGIQKGLTPKFENMSDVLGWYDRATNKAIADRGFFEYLREQKLIKPAGKAAADWVTLDPDRFPIRKWKGNTVQFKAPRDMATRINEYLYDPSSDPRQFVQGLHKAASFASFTKNIRLAAGVPFTKLNMHSFSVLAHHVLTTPTVKGVVPNIPRMIGRGLKGFGEMLDPRLHKWTDKELRQAKLLQKNGPLTLSTEDHIFAPEIKGTLAERLKNAKNIPSAFKTVVDRMFEEPLFQSHLPKMKLNVAWELQRQYRRQGMTKKAAFDAAGEVTNNLFGGLNLDEAGRNKIGQDMARLLILAPDWLESNLKTTKEIFKSPLGRTPKEKTYRDFATNLMGIYLSGTILQKALTGRWMHENSPGNQFSVYMGKTENGKERYVKPYGAGIAGIRLLYDAAESTARRQDISKFGDIVRNRLSIPVGAGSSVIFNRGPFGQPVVKKGDTLGGQLKDVGALAANEIVPQYIGGPYGAVTGQVSPLVGAAQTFEFPYTEVTPRNPDGSTPKKAKRRRRR